jgi:hypothetical protein
MTSAATHPQFVERRQTARFDVDLPAVIEMSCRPKIACRITDISLIGAMLKIDRKVHMLGQFDLIIAGRMTVRCNLRHRYKDRAGVSFVVPLEDLPA